MHTLKTLLYMTLLIFTLLLLSSTAPCAERCHPNDKKALIQIKKSFNNANVFTSWKPDTDCCEWRKVECDQHTNRITSLTLDNFDRELAGRIPESIGDLERLESITFCNQPRLTGPLPNSLSKLRYLNSINISKTNLTGTIPPSLGQLPYLKYINLQYNNLFGLIPASLSNLHKLGDLALDRNRLAGPFPDSFGAFVKKPSFHLRLSRNQLSGSIPKYLGSIDFSDLDLSRNKLTGDASVLFGPGKKLQTVGLSRNRFSFNMSKVVFPTSLGSLDLSYNEIYGSVSQSLGRVPNLRAFNVSHNKLCGRIPSGGGLKKFDASSYAYNRCLCGSPLPACK